MTISLKKLCIYMFLGYAVLFNTTYAWELNFMEDDIFAKDRIRINIAPDNTIVIYDMQNNIHINQIRNPGKSKIFAIVLSPDEKYLAVAGIKREAKIDNKVIALYHYKSDTPFKILTSHVETINDLAFSSDGKYLISASKDKSIKIWNMDSFTLMHTISFHTEGVYGVQMIKDKDHYKIFSVGFDKKIALHYFYEESELIEFQKSHIFPYKLKYISYDKIKKDIAICGEAKEVTIYNLSLEHIKTLDTSPMVPHKLRYHKNGDGLLVAGGRYSSRMFSYKTSDYSPYHE